jgi:protein farnesyltransferase subunit beta
LKACQHPDGGFGGGHGHLAHLAPTYAAVNTLALYSDDEAFGIIDRRKMYSWIMSLKQPDGGFLMHYGGEEDARYPLSKEHQFMNRSAYTALAIATLLNIRTEELVRGTDKWLVSCQTFEGGFSGSPASGEAHGGYAFCILAALCILHPPTDLPNYLDMDNLTVFLPPSYIVH